MIFLTLLFNIWLMDVTREIEELTVRNKSEVITITILISVDKCNEYNENWANSA